jgi:hypothetical protein
MCAAPNSFTKRFEEMLLPVQASTVPSKRRIVLWRKAAAIVRLSHAGCS